MRKIILCTIVLCFAATSFAGFKAKNIKPKKQEQFQAHATISGIGFAADLLLKGKDQKDFFCKELAPHDVIAIRLAIFNHSTSEVALLLEDIRLRDPKGQEVPMISANAVAKAAIEGIKTNSTVDQPKVRVSDKPPKRISQTNKTDPTYDPRTDPQDPNYDPRLDPTNPNYDPNCYPNSPCDKVRRRSIRLSAPGVHVDVNPYGSEYGTISETLIQKDFVDKSHSGDPIPPFTVRDKFLFFALADRPADPKGFELHIPQGNGIPQPVSLKF